MDSTPPKLLSQRLRLTLYGFLAAMFMFLYMEDKLLLLDSATCPKLVVEKYVVLSARDICSKSYAIVSLLALHGAYRCWRYPTEAVLLQAEMPLARLHEHETVLHKLTVSSRRGSSARQRSVCE